jgi:hypothetical protein
LEDMSMRKKKNIKDKKVEDKERKEGKVIDVK